MRFRFVFVLLVLTILLSLPRFAHHTPNSKHYINLVRYYRGDLERHNLRTPFAYRALVPFLAARCPSDDFLISTLGHPVNIAGRRAFVAQCPFSAKHVAPQDHLAIQNVVHTSFVSVQRPVVG